MGRQTSIETRKIIIDLHKKGKSLRAINKIVRRNHCTIKNIIVKHAKYNTVENLPGSKRSKRLTNTEISAIFREVKANPTSSAVKIAEGITKTSGKSVSASTIRRSLHQNGLQGRVPRKKPYISKVNQGKRMKFAKKYINEPPNFLFSDGSKFEIFGAKNMVEQE